jgi:hypothetical protein
VMSKKQQKEEDAKNLARCISVVAEKCLLGEISIENHSLINQALWSEAKRMRIWKRVDTLVNKNCEEEMNESLKKMGIKI